MGRLWRSPLKPPSPSFNALPLNRVDSWPTVLSWTTVPSKISESKTKPPSRLSSQCWEVTERGRRRSTPPQKRSSTLGPRSSSPLKLYKVDDVGKLERKRKECPQETCGAGIFLS